MQNLKRRDKTAGILAGNLLSVLVFLVFFFAVPTDIRAATPDPGRFFLMGDGLIHIRNTKTDKEASVSLYLPDGSLNEKGFSKIDEVFGFPTKAMGEHISPRLLSMLDYFSDLVAHGKVINLDSGYRSPAYNNKLRNRGGNVAKTSEHMDGMAADFYIEGIDGNHLWDIIRKSNCCGVGYYGGRDIHLDSGRPRFWEAATSKVRTGASDYNKKIYLSTEFDRYTSGDKARLILSSVSNYSFGVERTLLLVDEKSDIKTSAQITTGQDGDCLMIENRHEAHFLFFTLPAELPRGTYRVKITFCRRHYMQMPAATLSNKIEITGQGRKKTS